MTGRREMLKKAVKDLKDAGIDPDSAAGGVALGYLLGPPTPASPTFPPAGETLEGVHVTPTGEGPAEKIASRVGVSAPALRDRVEFDEDGARPQVRAAQLPQGTAERQRVLTLLKLTLDRLGVEVEEVPVSRLSALCDEYSALDQNFSTNLAKRDDLMSRRGKRGAFRYRATTPGLERGQELVRALVEGEAVLQV